MVHSDYCAGNAPEVRLRALNNHADDTYDCVRGLNSDSKNRKEQFVRSRPTQARHNRNHEIREESL